MALPGPLFLRSQVHAGGTPQCGAGVMLGSQSCCLSLVHTLLTSSISCKYHVRFTLACFAFHAVEQILLLSQEFSADSTTNVHVFNYDATDSELMRLLVPPLNYVAPELISGTRATGALTSATDTYSFGEDQL